MGLPGCRWEGRGEDGDTGKETLYIHTQRGPFTSYVSTLALNAGERFFLHTFISSLCFPLGCVSCLFLSSAFSFGEADSSPRGFVQALLRLWCLSSPSLHPSTRGAGVTSHVSSHFQPDGNLQHPIALLCLPQFPFSSYDFCFQCVCFFFFKRAQNKYV